MHMYADKSRAQCAWAAVYYSALRERGVIHAQVLRCHGQRWMKKQIPIIHPFGRFPAALPLGKNR
jgi:hypothetical protein